MRDARFKIETDQERAMQESARKPWRTPRVIESDAKNAETATVLLDDGPSSVS